MQVCPILIIYVRNQTEKTKWMISFDYTALGMVTEVNIQTCWEICMIEPD